MDATKDMEKTSTIAPDNTRAKRIQELLETECRYIEDLEAVVQVHNTHAYSPFRCSVSL